MGYRHKPRGLVAGGAGRQAPWIRDYFGIPECAPRHFTELRGAGARNRHGTVEVGLALATSNFRPPAERIFPLRLMFSVPTFHLSRHRQLDPDQLAGNQDGLGEGHRPELSLNDRLVAGFRRPRIDLEGRCGRSTIWPVGGEDLGRRDDYEGIALYLGA